jgi:hypothetical protein
MNNVSLEYFNSIHLQMVTPLMKWRIMDVSSLRNNIFKDSNKRSFLRIIKNLERAKVLLSYIDPWTSKKFVYLSKHGESFLPEAKNNISISTETMHHDSKVSLYAQRLLELSCFDEVTLEHQIAHSKSFRGSLPDAVIDGMKNDSKFKMAFELELTRKSKDRIRTKIASYLESNHYDYVLYVFCKEELMKSYIKIIVEKFGEDAFRKLVFFYNPTIFSEKIDLKQGYGYFKSKTIKFNELFN